MTCDTKQHLRTALMGALVLALAGCSASGDSGSNNSAMASNVTGANTAMSNSAGGFGSTVESGFRKQFVASFNLSCVKSAHQAGLGVDPATKICGCAADDLSAKYSVQQLMSLTPATVQPVVKQCAIKLGLAKS